MRRCIQILLCLALLTPACGEEPTAIYVNIFAEAGVDIMVPTDINWLEISIEVADEQVWIQTFPRDYSTPRPLEESITFRPGKAADDAIRVVVTGLHDLDRVATGKADAKFITTKIQHANVAVNWIPGICLDLDGDSHGKGQEGSCAGTDCDETDPAINSSAREECNNIDDDCDGNTDDILEADSPRCTHYMGVCKLARQNCVDGAWDECASGYGPDYEVTETSCDMLDNDCDGPIDEGCTCILGSQQECDAPNQGVCIAGIQRCEQVTPTEGEWGDACDGALPPLIEDCNTADDDCDGLTDEDFDLFNDNSNCGECDNVCAAGLRCYNGDCLPDCPLGFFPATTNSVPVCISTLQEAATPCAAFANCKALDENAMVGYGGDGWVISVPPPPGLAAMENPITVWTEVTGDVQLLSSRYVCLDPVPDPPVADGGGVKSCPDCNTACDNCVPEDCPASLTDCGKCGCALRYWCHITM
jgi:hypothetical protein